MDPLRGSALSDGTATAVNAALYDLVAKSNGDELQSKLVKLLGYPRISDGFALFFDSAKSAQRKELQALIAKREKELDPEELDFVRSIHSVAVQIHITSFSPRFDEEEIVDFAFK